MKESYYAGVYWLARGEPVDDCARRAEALFQLLAGIDPLFARWFEKADSLNEALRFQIDTSAAAIKGLMLREERSSLDDWFSLSGWNGDVGEGNAGLSLTVGSSSQRVSNRCVVDLPSEGLPAQRVLCASGLAQLLHAMATTWEPEWGVVTTSEHRQLVSATSRVGTFVGWLTYFSRRRGEVPPLPPPVQVQPVGDKGTLVVLTPERLTASNPQHVELALQVAERLGEAGLLEPLKPWER